MVLPGALGGLGGGASIADPASSLVGLPRGKTPVQ